MRGMLSRAAENIYWMGRYVERSAEICRMLNVGEQLTVELRGLSPEMACQFWRQLDEIYPGSMAPHVEGNNVDEVSLSYLWAYLVGPGNDLSVASSIRRARENARAVREYLTREVFELINQCWLKLDVDIRSAGQRHAEADEVVQRVMREVYGISGAIDRTFIRDEAWLFLTMGMMFERMYRGLLVMQYRLPILLENPADLDIPLHHARVRGVLRSLASLENYRRVHGADLDPHRVARFLLFDEHTPHSVRVCLGRMEQAINILEAGTGMSEAARLIGRMSSRLRYEENELMALGDLETVCAELVASVTEVNDVLSHQYFTT
ncbi:MAG: alpha-E domain-containing protein [Phycisphaerales bacterium]|nr:alpha-E domain-containing protein [Phycisphaerales bacterium]